MICKDLTELISLVDPPVVHKLLRYLITTDSNCGLPYSGTGRTQ